MPKYLMECSECEKRFQTRNPVTRRQCPSCQAMTDFILVEEKQPVTFIRKKGSFDIMCLRCRTVRHAPPIPKACGCGQRFERHSENETVTDILYNYFIGSSKDKGYMKVTVSREGTVWWTPEKDEFGDDVDPLIGDSSRTGQSSYMGQGDVARDQDDLRPVFKQTTTAQKKRDFRS